MGIIDKFLGIFKHKEVVNEETVTEKVKTANEESPIVVNDTTNTPVMVRADDFQDSSVAPEEYKVADSDDEVEEVIEEIADHGIDVSEGDDMTPIIMDVEENQEVLETIDETSEVVEEVIDAAEEVEVIEETLEEDIEIL